MHCGSKKNGIKFWCFRKLKIYKFPNKNLKEDLNLEFFVTANSNYNYYIMSTSVHIAQPPRRMQWRPAVLSAIHRLVSQTGNAVFTRQQLIENELDEIIRHTQSIGKTPASTMDRVHQELVREGKIERVVDGVFRFLPPSERTVVVATTSDGGASPSSGAKTTASVVILQPRNQAIRSLMVRSVLQAIQRQVTKHHSEIIFKDQMIHEELDTVISESHCKSINPRSVVVSALRDLCRLGLIEKLHNGKAYRIVKKQE